MAQIELEGETLGQKQRSFNALVKAAAADDSFKLGKISYDCSDAQNLVKIEVACIRKKVEFILEVLKCKDMLYVCRALRGSTWLLTDAQYEHIINPEYLNEQLFARMTSKAKNKMLTSIRNNLKDSARVETFFDYYKDNMTIAQYWLRHCSIDFIEDIVEKHADELSFNVLKHICRKSPKILKSYLRSNSRDCSFLHKYLLKAENNKEVIDILDSIYSANQRVPNFRKRFTRSLMIRYPVAIIENFAKYYYGLHLPTFVKYLKKEEDVEVFFVQQIRREFLNNFCRYDILKHFLRYIPETQRSPLIETILSGKENPHGLLNASNLRDLKGSLGLHAYEFTTFDYAFSELKKVLEEESYQTKRNSILTVLIRSTRRNQQHIQAILEYYQLHHMDDSLKDKLQFLSNLLVPSSIHRYDKCVWSLINEIFIDVNFNIDTMPRCLETLIVYRILQDEHIPEALVKKINFKSFINCASQLNTSEQYKILDYVLNSCFKKNFKKEVDNEAEMCSMVDLMTSALIFLRDWNKGPDDFPYINDNIRDILKKKIENSWNTDLSSIYQSNKLFRKTLLNESLLLNPSDVTVVNVLKHNPNLLLFYRDTFAATVSLKRSLSKFKIYWPKSTVQEWVDIYLDCLSKNPTSHKTIIVKNLCIILPREEAMSILVQKYAPGLMKWEDINDNEIVIGQNIARYLHLIRPWIDEKALLLYAKKQYLPYLLPSFDTILRNQSSYEFWESILYLLDTKPLHRYAARLVLSLIKNNQPEGYKSVKTQLIKKLEKLLYKEKDPAAALDIWNLFSKVFDDLPLKHQISLAHFYHLPDANKVVINKFFMKIHSFNKTQNPNNSNNRMLMEGATRVFDYLELHFVENVLLKVVSEEMTSPKHGDGQEILCMYLLHCKCEQTQIQRYEKVLIPIMDHYYTYCTSWPEKDKLYRILDMLTDTCYQSITEFKSIVPVKLFTSIRDKLTDTLGVEVEFKLIMTWNLNVIFVKIFNDHLKVEDSEIVNDKVWDRICQSFVNDFGQASLDYLMPILLESSSYHIFVSRVCVELFSAFRIDRHFKLLFVKYLLSNVTDQIIYFVAIDILRCPRLTFNEIKDEAILLLLYKELIQMIRSHPSIAISCYYNHYADVLLME